MICVASKAYCFTVHFKLSSVARRPEIRKVIILLIEGKELIHPWPVQTEGAVRFWQQVWSCSNCNMGQVQATTGHDL